MYGSLSSLISEIISKSGFLTINLLVIKSIIYCLAMLIFSLQSPKEFIIYGTISAVFYYLLEEFIRYNQKKLVEKLFLFLQAKILKVMALK